MKLNVKRRYKKPDESWQKCCRWCKHYSKGYCMRQSENMYESGVPHDEWFEHACEEGRIQETLRGQLEEFRSYGAFFDDVQNAAQKCGVSNKNLTKFRKMLNDCYDIFVQDNLPLLDAALCKSLEGYNLDYGFSEDEWGVYVPEDFCCDYWE